MSVKVNMTSYVESTVKLMRWSSSHSSMTNITVWVCTVCEWWLLCVSRSYNGHFPDGPGLAGTRLSPLWILLELMVMVGGGDNRSYKTCKTPVNMSPPTNQHRGTVSSQNCSCAPEMSHFTCRLVLVLRNDGLMMLVMISILSRPLTDWFHGFHPARVRKSLVLKTLVSAAD